MYVLLAALKESLSNPCVATYSTSPLRNILKNVNKSFLWFHTYSHNQYSHSCLQQTMSVHTIVWVGGPVKQVGHRSTPGMPPVWLSHLLRCMLLLLFNGQGAGSFCCFSFVTRHHCLSYIVTFFLPLCLMQIIFPIIQTP